jgi:hypothetical protein
MEVQLCLQGGQIGLFRKIYKVDFLVAFFRFGGCPFRGWLFPISNYRKSLCVPEFFPIQEHVLQLNLIYNWERTYTFELKNLSIKQLIIYGVSLNNNAPESDFRMRFISPMGQSDILKLNVYLNFLKNLRSKLKVFTAYYPIVERILILRQLPFKAFSEKAKLFKSFQNLLDCVEKTCFLSQQAA